MARQEIGFTRQRHLNLPEEMQPTYKFAIRKETSRSVAEASLIRIVIEHANGVLSE